jgi:hypothetical protein
VPLRGSNAGFRTSRHPRFVALSKYIAAKSGKKTGENCAGPNTRLRMVFGNTVNPGDQEHEHIKPEQDKISDLISDP